MILVVIAAGAAAAGVLVAGLPAGALLDPLAVQEPEAPAEDAAPEPLIFPTSNAIGRADRLAREIALPFTPPADLAPFGEAIPRGAAEAAVTVLLAPPQWREPEKPTGVLLNEAQITSIRERLRLSPEQERLWPGAEDALRRLVTRLYRAQRSRSFSLPDEDEIAQIKAQAAPFIASLTSRQRNDIRLLAGIAGLDLATLGM